MVEVVTIRCDSFTANIYLPLFFRWPIGRAKKLFRLLQGGLYEGYQENVEAKEAIWTALEDQAADAYKEWGRTSQVFSREWVDIDFLKRSGQPTRGVKSKNASLLAEVKRAKATYERLEKLKKYFREIVND